jgi:tetratricopeptide (TPR) repeat protein
MTVEREAGPCPSNSRFEPVSLLGQGAMGVVYRVVDRETDSDIALKTFAVSNGEELYRLKAEFRVLADMGHPNLVELYELFTEGEQSYFTMEYVGGTDFVRALRGDPALLAERISSAAAQLADGVASLHAAGRLHRDIKPSNVLVTPEGRVVLLDFGLATMFGHDVPPHYGRGVTGTVAYMAPEVLLGGAPTPEADWYSVGVLLYETLAGELPCADAAARTGSADPSPLPAPWDGIVSSLLGDSPDARRAAAQRLLGDRRGSWDRVRGSRGLFVGRSAELAMLAEAHDASRSGCRVVHVVGPSGIGKSELLRQFLGDIEAAGTVILAGRCHAQESVPYKAIDPIVDRVSRVFVADPELARRCLPDDAGSVRRLFPVLGRIPGFAAAPDVVAAEPLEMRRRGFASLRDLFRKLAAERQVIVWIDDLQWGDPDSMLLLRELQRVPEPRMLVLLSYRSEDSGIPLLRRLAEEAGPAESRIDLGPLSTSDGEKLVEELGRSASRVAAILAEAGGNPFLLSELARSISEGRDASRLADLVGERLADLGTQAHRLLEVLSISGGPLPRSIVLEASGLGERGRPVVGQLEKRSLLRTTSLGERIAVEMYHDRIRETLLAAIPDETTRSHHAALADVLERQTVADAEALYRHNLGAGRREMAGSWARTAADRASAAFAFERAAELYGEALVLAPSPVTDWAIREKRAEALANGGRALEAAHAYREASRELAGLGEADQRKVLRLRERAATHYIQTGHLDEGMEVTREVLREVGIRYPRSQGRAILASLLQRARLGMRGFGYELRPGAMSDAQKLRLEVCWSAAISLTMVDPAGSDTLGVRHLLESLDSGDPHETMRAFGAEAGRSAQFAGKYMRRRCARLTDRMETLVERYGEPFDRAHLHSARGMIAFQSSLWKEAHEHFAASSAILRRDCHGVSWERATIETFGLSALAHSGQFRRLAELLPEAIGDASDRGDLYATLLFHTGVMNQDWLVRDEADEALAVADEAMARWPSSDVFQVQHYVHLIATVNADLYRGDPWSAFARVDSAWPRLRAAMFLALESARVELRNLRARAALAAAVSPVMATGAARPDRGRPRERLLALASAEAKRLARIEDVVSARPFARLLEAGVASAHGDDAAARIGYEEAERMLRDVDMSVHAAAAAWRRGQMVGSGDSKREPCDDALLWAERERVRRPEAMLPVFAPAA